MFAYPELCVAGRGGGAGAAAAAEGFVGWRPVERVRAADPLRAAVDPLRAADALRAAPD